MLETLLNHFRSYGLNDLEFIIVNSKLSHAQERLHELKNRVSFDVLQETEEEEVWNLMEGGKDDMYIYDRCGRLTFYIPFPLSILNETPLVANAILTTYFRSPCGDNCLLNKTMDVDEFVKSLETNLETSNETLQVNETQMETELPFFINETQNETSSSNDLLSIIDTAQEDIDLYNSSLPSNTTEYEYPDYDNSNVNNTNNTKVDKAKSYFNSIYKLFFNNENDIEEKQETNETLTNNSNTTRLPEFFSDHNSTYDNKEHNHTLNKHKHHNHHSHHHNHHHHHPHHDHPKHEHRHGSNETKKSDRCLEADYQVCRSWTKKRLLHAQKCCTGKQYQVDISDPKSCYNFGKRRCKKIQSILKCCIKTVYTDNSSIATSNETTPVPGIESTTIPADKIQSPTVTQAQYSHITCCKPSEDGRLIQCRTIFSGNCDDYESVVPPAAYPPAERNCETTPCQNDKSSEGEKHEKSATP